MEIVVVQLPRGWSAVVGFDSATRVAFTNHSGLLGTLFKHGVKNLDGKVVHPSDGRSFLSAVYDHLFLNGYQVRWLHSVESDLFLEETQ